MSLTRTGKPKSNNYPWQANCFSIVICQMMVGALSLIYCGKGPKKSFRQNLTLLESHLIVKEGDGVIIWTKWW